MKIKVKYIMKHEVQGYEPGVHVEIFEKEVKAFNYKEVRARANDYREDDELKYVQTTILHEDDSVIMFEGDEGEVLFTCVRM